MSLLFDSPASRALLPATLYRFVAGVDSDFVVMPSSEMGVLNDPMASLLKSGRFPLTAEALLAELDATNVLPKQSSFLISEAGQISPETFPTLPRDMRLVVVRGNSAEADLVISTGGVGERDKVFLQVVGWDEPAGCFNFYMRLAAAWVFAGNSFHALTAPSRGEGCFDSHVNGGLVMKEMKQPWLNWDSMNATILLADDDPLRTNPIYLSRSGAEALEPVVRGGISRWTRSRIKRSVTPDRKITDADLLLRPLCATTTVNLTSSATASKSAAGHPGTAFPLPLGFWLNADLLLDSLEIPADFDLPAATGQLYADALARYDFAVVQGDFRLPGDAFFAFVVPEASFEDTDVVDQLLRNGIITPHLAASILMVDFPNPVFSERRAALLPYMPARATLSGPAGGLSEQIAEAVSRGRAVNGAGSPEAEFISNWEIDESQWRNVFALRLQSYMAAVSTRVRSDSGFDDYVRLAESRRREFREMRLNEFTLSLPVTNIPSDAPRLKMSADGTIRETTASTPSI